MVHFLKLISTEPEICKVPIMVDSQKWEVLEEGLKNIQGKSLVNQLTGNTTLENNYVFIENDNSKNFPHLINLSDHVIQIDILNTLHHQQLQADRMDS